MPSLLGSEICIRERSSVCYLNYKELPGISGRRISIESASKVWNACGLRIGSMVTDNEILHEKVVSEYTANLCANAIGQYIFSSILQLSKHEIKMWFEDQRIYYHTLMVELRRNLSEKIQVLYYVNQTEDYFFVLITSAGPRT